MTTARPADWKEFDDFSAGIATNRLPDTDALSGREFKLLLSSGRRVNLRFLDRHLLEWTIGEDSGTDWYEAIIVSADTYFIDMTYASRPAEDETFIVNSRSKRVLAISERVRSGAEAPGEPRVAQNYESGILDDGGTVLGMEPSPTRELVGLTAHYEYSPNHLYEHIYLSSQRYAWQNLIGVQRGHGDVDLATTYKFDEGQYVFGFREFIIPVASLFFYNWADMRSTGKFLGVTKNGIVENKPAGAYITKKSQVEYSATTTPV